MHAVTRKVNQFYVIERIKRYNANRSNWRSQVKGGGIGVISNGVLRSFVILFYHWRRWKQWLRVGWRESIVEDEKNRRRQPSLHIKSFEKHRMNMSFQLKGPWKTSISRQVESSQTLWYFECRCNRRQRNFHHFQISQSMNSFYFSLELQNGILISTRILFVVSSFFNAIAFFCLLKETPEHQSKFRNYLLCIQVFCFIYCEKSKSQGIRCNKRHKLWCGSWTLSDVSCNRRFL